MSSFHAQAGCANVSLPAIRPANERGNSTVSKLLEKFRANPSAENRQKLQTYINRHMMAVCMATAEELAFLKTHDFKI